MGKVNVFNPVNPSEIVEYDDTDAEGIRAAIASGWKVETVEGEVARTISARRTEDNSGLLNQGVAGGLGLARGITAGGSDLLIRAAGGDDVTHRVRGIREANPITSTLTEIGGAVVPGVLSGGTGTAGVLARATPAGAISRLGAGVAAAGEGAGALTRGARLVAGGAVEGALTEAGAAMSDLALADDPLSIERIAGSLSHRALFGGAIGGGAAGAVGGLGAGLGFARKRLTAASAAFAQTDDVAADLAVLDRKALRKAEEAELATIEAARVPQRQQLADEVAAFREQTKLERPWDAVATGNKDAIAAAKAAADEAQVAALKAQQRAASLTDEVAELDAKTAARGGARDPGYLDAELAAARQAAEEAQAAAAEAASKLTALSAKAPRWMREAGKVAFESDKALDRVLRNPKALAERPHLARAALQQQEAALEKVLAGADELKVRYATDTSGTRQKAFDLVAPTLERNRALQRKIADLTAAPASERLQAITGAVDALSGSGKKTLGENMASGAAYGMTASAVSAIPVVGPFLAPFAGARIADAISGKLGPQLLAATKAATERATKAVDAFLTVTKGAQKVAPKLATIVASRVLADTRFAESDERPAADGKRKPRPTMDEAFDARADELSASVVLGEDGRLKVRPHIRTAINQRLSGLAAVAPHVADRLETHAARRLVFLASKLPKRPMLGMTLLRPSELEIRAFARYLAAADDPGGIEERLADGTVTPEDAEVMRELYPERLADITRQILERLPTLRTTLPYHRRLALSFMTGVPVDAAMEPYILASLQAQYEQEPGTEGGTQAPQAQPAFGSVKKSIPNPTPAQLRAAGAGATS
jgi:hypothetical protein